MVRSSISDADRKRSSRWLKAGFVGLVAASAATVAVQAGGSTSTVVIALAGGLVVGGLLTWFVARNLREIQPDGLRDRQR